MRRLAFRMMPFVLVGLMVAPRWLRSEPQEPPAPGLEVVLQERAPGGITVTFHNTSRRPIVVFRPRDGSEWGWVRPYYRFTVTAEDGTELEPILRCGLFGAPYSGTKWPDDYAVTLKPRERFEIPIFIPQLGYNRQRRGTFRIRLEYEMRDVDPTDPIRDLEIPEGTWIGKAVANELVITRPRPGS